MDNLFSMFYGLFSWLAAQKLSVMIFSLGQVFLGQDFSQSPALECKVEKWNADSVYFSAKIMNGHGKLMDDYLRSGLPVRLRMEGRLFFEDSLENGDQRTIHQAVQFQIHRNTYVFSRAQGADSMNLATERECWDKLLFVPNFAFPSVPLYDRRFSLHLTANLEEVYVPAIDERFDPMYLWGNKKLEARTQPIRFIHFGPARHARVSGENHAH